MTETVCEVCGKPLIDENELPPDIREKVYRPSEEEAKEAVEINV